MSWRAAAGVVAIVAMAEGLWIWSHQRAHAKANRQAADAIAATQREHQVTDSTQAAAAAAYSARRAADDSAVADTREVAVATGDAVETGLEGLDVSVCDSAALDTLTARLGRLRLAWKEHAAADSTARVAEDRRHRADSVRIATLEHVELPRVRGQRDAALDSGRVYLARAIAAERGWSPLRRVVTGASCVAAGVLVVAKEWTPAAATGGACAVSLALP